MQSTLGDNKILPIDPSSKTKFTSSMAQSEGSTGEDFMTSKVDSNVNDPMMCTPPCNKCVSMYCKSCEEFVCTTCTEKEHTQHEVCSMPTLIGECEKRLLKQTDDLEQRLVPLQNALRDITHVLADLDESRETSKKQVNDSFDLLERALSCRRGELLRSIDTIYNAKQSKLVKQADITETRIRNLEDGLDVVLLSLSPTRPYHATTNGDEVGCTGAEHASISSDMRLFFTHKQVSQTLSDLSNEYESDLSSMNTDDTLSDNTTHQARSISEDSTKTTKGIIPCENSHITLNNMHDLSKINLMISNLGLAETSHAVVQRCYVSGQAVTTSFCRAGEENSIVLTAMMSSGELETTGKVQVSVHIEYTGPPDKSDIVNYRSLRSNHSRSAASRNTWDGSRLPVSSYQSKSNPTTPRKRAVRSTSREANSPTAFDRRGPLKDLLFPRSPEPSQTEVGTSSTLKDAEISPTTSVTPRIDYLKNGAYEITFTPSVPGKYQILIEVYGKPIHQGPFCITAIDTKSRLESRQPNISGRESFIPARSSNTRPKVTKDEPDRRVVAQKGTLADDLIIKVGSKGRLNGQFSNPQGVSIDHLGRLLVADSSNQCMQVFSVDPKKTKEYRFLFKFAEKGRGCNQVQRPTGIYGLPNGDIAVSDYDNKLVKIYGQNGKHKRNIGSGKLMGPKGVCLDRNGHLIVVDNKLCQIMIFQMNGRLVTKFGSHGTEPHQLAGPHFVAVNKDNCIYVSDFYNHCVKIFSSQGDCLGIIGSSGERRGQFNAPTGIAIDSRENLIVADWGNSRLQVFDKHGSFLSYVKTNHDPLYGPQGLTTIHEDFVAVADSGNQCVKIYHYSQ